MTSGTAPAAPRRWSVNWRQRGVRLAPEQARRVSLALAAALVLGLTATLAAPAGTNERAIETNMPAPRDFTAPRTVTYASAVLSERERERAAQGVSPIFQPTDPGVGPRQAAHARGVLGLVGRHRSDTTSTAESKVQKLFAIPELAGLSPDLVNRLVAMDDAEWATVQAEVPTVVAQTLREPVRPDSVGIARTSTVSYVERSIDASTASLIAAIASGFVVPNTAIDEEKSAEARQEAAESVAPQMKSVAAGQTVVRAGDIVSPEIREEMEELGLLRRQVDTRTVAGMFLLATLLVVVASTLLALLHPSYWLFPRRVALMVALVLVFTVGARVAAGEHLLLALVFPAAAASMTATVLLGLESGLAVALLVAPLVGVLSATGLEAAVYVLAGSLAGSVALGRVERLSAFLAGGLALMASNLAVVLAFRLPAAIPDVQGALEIVAACAANAALAAGLSAIGLVAAGSVLGMATTLQLLELARPDVSLLRELQIKAPGTYQHSILLSNLAEQAAHAVGANALLVRVGAYYHDVGKTRRPYFFVENQPPGSNPHENLDTYASARIVISHVPDGVALCREHGLPAEVIDFVWQHHGTTRAEYFYRQAVELLGEDAVDESAFRYPGPRPRSREAAILMLADGSEAAVRSAAPDSQEKIDEVVSRIIRSRLNAGELDDSRLTLHDLKVIRRTFVETLTSVYHPRIRYPEGLSPAPAGATEGAMEPLAGTIEDRGNGSPADAEEHIAASVTDPREDEA